MGIELYEFQKEDVDKLVQCPGALDASEMGTGKTYKGAAVAMARAPDRPKLWVGPLGTLEGSASKIRQMYPDVPITRIDPKNRHASFAAYKANGSGFFLMHWEALRLMPDVAEHYWGHVVADEVHKAQNRKAQQTRALKKLKAASKLGMSGTPVTGAPDKFWSGLNWMYPQIYRGYWEFYKNYVDYEIIYPQGFHKIKGPKNEARLLERIDPFYVRHLKKEQCCPRHPDGVMPWLPDKYYDEPVWVDLKPEQRRAYNQMKEDMIAWIGQHEHEALVAPVVIAQMIRLQQFASAYACIDDEGKVRLSEPSSKIDALMNILEDNPTEPIVVFSRFTQMLDLAAARMRKDGVSYVTYTGKNRNTRDEEKAVFVSGGARVFLGSIGAGGVGVDGLQDVSSTAVFLDRDWSPAINQQAEDRLHRDGQVNGVHIIDIMARNTVDLGRQARLEMKWDWIRRLLGDD